MLRDKVIAGVLFLVFLTSGLYMAQFKPLWNDERSSLIVSMQQPYSDIFLGKIGEGNNSPLFYVIQKMWTQCLNYHIPAQWLAGDWNLMHPYSQILLRFWPVVCMSLAVVLIFYYCCRRYNLLLGVYSLGVALSSFMVWAYAFEARPYALWFLLTTLQVLFTLTMLQQPVKGKPSDTYITLIINMLLALTTVLSVLQLVVMGMVMWVAGRRNWKTWLLVYALPILVTVYYRVFATKLAYFFVEGITQLIGAALPLDRLVICVLTAGVWVKAFVLKEMPWSQLRLTGYVLMIMTLLLVCNILFLLYLLINQHGDGVGFRVPNRYFMPLASVGIIGVSLFSDYLVKSFKGYSKVIVIGILGALLYWRMMRTLALVGSLHMFVH